jgi:branched-chain amino acid transport system substrate-binding protein
VRLPGGARPLELLCASTARATPKRRCPCCARRSTSASPSSRRATARRGGGLIDALDKHNAARAAAPRAAAELLGRRPGADQRALQLLALPLRRPCRHAPGRAGGRAARRQRAARVYLIGQDYSFGQHVHARRARCWPRAGPDVAIVGDELHPMGRVKDFMPYAAKIKASGAQAVLTGNWGNDLTLLVRALREVGSTRAVHLLRQRAGRAGGHRRGRHRPVLAVAEWHPNVGGAASDAFYAAFRRASPIRGRLRAPAHAGDGGDAGRGHRTRGSTEAAGGGARAGRRAPSTAARSAAWHTAVMRAADHQLQQPLVVSVMDRRHARRAHDVEGSGFGFRTVRRFDSPVCQPHSCRMHGPMNHPLEDDPMRAAIENLPGSKIREVANAGLGRSRRAGLLVRRERRGHAARPSAQAAANRCSAARPSIRTTWACPNCARPSPPTPAACTGRSARPHRRHLVGRHGADAGDADAGGPATRWWPWCRCGPT